MARYIDADELCRYIKTECNPYGAPTLEFDTSVKIMEFIEKASTTDVAEVKHARRGLHIGHQHYCSNCGRLAYCENYCSNCGAKMDGKENNDVL